MSMCTEGTRLEHYPELGLWVKREDLCCPGGPNFSKTRGVYAHVAARPEKVIGVLDTAHSQGGWAVARACQLLDKQCVLFYPVRKADQGMLRPPHQQNEARKIGARLVKLQAGRSAVLYHAAKKQLPYESIGRDPYMMPNALKLPEMITETVAEVSRTELPDLGEEGVVLVSASSGTIAAGVWRGLWERGYEGQVIVHQGYSRSQPAVLAYMTKMAWGGVRPPLDKEVSVELVDEGYAYADEAKPGPVPPFPSNKFYDLKAFRWWMAVGREKYKEALFWNIG